MINFLFALIYLNFSFLNSIHSLYLNIFPKLINCHQWPRMIYSHLLFGLSIVIHSQIADEIKFFKNRNHPESEIEGDVQINVPSSFPHYETIHPRVINGTK